MTPKVSILIANWNGRADLQRSLPALCLREAEDWEVVVIDNGSTDGSVEYIHAAFPQVRLCANSRNVGHTRAVNQGFAMCRGKYILVLDSDAVIESGSLRQVLAFMEARPDVSVAAPRTYYPDGSLQESARDFPSALSGLFGRRSVLTRLFPNNRFSRRYLMRDRLEATEPFEVQQVSSACMLLRRDLIGQAGPWDEGYTGYWVDTDWCMRLRRLGKKIYCVPGASVVHHERNRPGRPKTARRILLFHRGAFRLWRKNYTLGWLDPRTPVAGAALALRATLQVAWNAARLASRETA